MKPLSKAQLRTLAELAAHAGEFRPGYGRSAHALARRGLAKRKFTSDDGAHLITKFAISSKGAARHSTAIGG